MKLTDTADAFPRCRFCICPPVHSLAPLRSLTNTLTSLANISNRIVWRLVIICSPNIYRTLSYTCFTEICLSHFL